MKNTDMTKEQLLDELKKMKQRIAELETELSKNQEFESLSVFASGIAHEYNNLLTAIIGNLALAKMYAKPGYEVYDVLAEAEKASIRAKDLTLQLLTFADGKKPVKKPLFLEKPLQDWITSALCDSQIIPELSIEENLWAVEADELQIHNVINSIVLNARNAMSGKGLIRVKAENADMDSSTGLPLRKGKYVLISLEDNRTGVSEGLSEKTFDPFYAAGQKNSGLGLYTSYSIIKNYYGHLTVDSRPGISTIFRIYLPVYQKKVPLSEETLKEYPTGKGKILVMDDEEIVRLVVSKLLNQCGYDAELAGNGKEMLQLYKAAMKAGSPFNAVIMDLVIEEGMGGQEAIKYLLEIDPNAKAIVSSGYSNAPVMSHFQEFGFIGFLAKPYRLDELGKVLHETLAKIAE
jgi:nitrogen-specific signal transduction histidine kinase/ActR/RegA family two-component response regulator